MAESVNRQILLASRPEGAPTLDNFRINEAAIAEPDEGEALMRSLSLSLDPSMRGRMSDRASHAEPVPVGGVMGGGAVGRAMRSNGPDMGAWQQNGGVRYKEYIVEGVEHAPARMIGLLAGENFGKLLVRAAPDPTL